MLMHIFAYLFSGVLCDFSYVKYVECLKNDWETLH